jgi:ribonucleotide monophosphatase NagD (HAD superfamily)
MLTNASFCSSQHLNETKFKPFGLTDFPLQNIYSSGIITAKTLKSLQPSEDKNSVFVVGNPGLKALIKEETGFNVVDDTC